MSDPLADPGIPLLHTRSYEVKSFRVADDVMRLRGIVHDFKPPGVYIEGDPEPMSIHRMVVDLLVAFPSLEITSAEVVMDTHPHETCPGVVAHYENLVGLSIARGFTHKVRELFGGPRGCTHTTALLQAMAPVAIQSLWSMMAPMTDVDGVPPTPEQVRQRLQTNLNTCHVWAEDGAMFAAIDRGEEIPPPMWASERLVTLGRSVEDWRKSRR